MNYKIIRQKYLGYLKKRDHSEIINGSLVPENDPTILFTPAGMSPIVPYLLGEKHPQGTRLTNIQRCIRTGDIEDVGDNVHLTFFEMAGNWSLNDYFKEEAIDITFTFLVEELKLDPEKLYGSVFEGDNDAGKDKEAIESLKKIFKKFGIEAKTGSRERIQFFKKKDCWWELPAGGPCGPCSEIFYDTGRDYCGQDCDVNCNCGKFVELGNNVFMEFLKKGPELYEPLGKHNVDFGGGIARWAMFLQEVDNVFDIDIYVPIKQKVEALAKENNLKSIRIVTEHINTAVFILMDGVVPSNTEQGYVLRRIIRRAIRHAKQIGIPTPFAKEIAEVVITQWKEIYPQLEDKKNFIFEELEKEEDKFLLTLDKSLKEFDSFFKPYIQTKVHPEFGKQKELDNSKGATYLFYETYGMPVEIQKEEFKKRNIATTTTFLREHEEAFKSHQDKSRAGQGDRFKGGLADTSEMSTKYHTTTHLLNAALKEVIGKHVYQKGSNITPERLRFDFPNDSKLTPEQVKAVEDWVNDKIEKKLPVTYEEMTPQKAKEIGAEGIFSHKYGEKVKVYVIGEKSKPTSMEICGGPHVTNTVSLGKFRIKKQENVGAGVKRIKAVLE